MSTDITELLSPYEVGTFCGLPRLTPGSVPKAALLGIPFDMGLNASRIGCRQGPDHIRRSALPDRRFLFHSERDFISALDVMDQGNLALVPGDVEQAMERIERATGALLAAGTVPITMGGDGSVTLPQLRAAHRRFGTLAVIHCDAHSDAWDVEGAGRYTTTTTFLRAHEEGLVDPELTFHVGVRGTLSSLGGTHARVSPLGHRIITMDDFAAQGSASVAATIAASLGDRPVYVCWDMDFFDPSAAPGVAIPEWGGPTAREGLDFLRAFAGLNAVALDVNTVSPPHDVQGLTGNLAVRVILEFLDILAARRDVTAS
ncbi:arginase family protein [Streptomyces sp. NPDC058469]|uniref:arginase family protein n=1 Tax=Streptomyces sp. NPDC058469 TaxID=3346514 RepID=UPI003647BE19